MKATATILTAFVFLVPARQATATPIQWSGNGHYYDAVLETITWPGAKLAAELQHHLGIQGHLVTISNTVENDFINTTFHDEIRTDPFGLWAGFTDQVVEGEWRWIDDTPGIWQDPDNFASPIQTAFTDWNQNEPNDVGGEDFLTISENRWNDFTSAATRVGYLIEFAPEPTSLFLFGIGLFALTSVSRCRRTTPSLSENRAVGGAHGSTPPLIS